MGPQGEGRSRSLWGADQLHEAPPTTEWFALDSKFLMAVQIAYEEIIHQNQNGKNSKD